MWKVLLGGKVIIQEDVFHSPHLANNQGGVLDAEVLLLSLLGFVLSSAFSATFWDFLETKRRLPLTLRDLRMSLRDIG